MLTITIFRLLCAQYRRDFVHSEQLHSYAEHNYIKDEEEEKKWIISTFKLLILSYSMLPEPMLQSHWGHFNKRHVSLRTAPILNHSESVRIGSIISHFVNTTVSHDMNYLNHKPINTDHNPKPATSPWLRSSFCSFFILCPSIILFLVRILFRLQNICVIQLDVSHVMNI